MAKNSTKNYVKGSAKLVSFPDGGELINLDLKLESISSLPVNEAGYVKLTLSRNKRPDQYGNAYAIYENDYKPEPKAGAAAPKAPSVQAPKFNRKGDLPF